MPATILILAGRRGGAVDPLAAEHGLADKCLVPVCGLPMLVHVLHAALSSNAGRILISVHEPTVEQQIMPLMPADAAARIRFVPSADNLTDSVLNAVRDEAFPLFITTADACLLTAATIAELEAEALSAGAQAAVGFARQEDVLHAHPDGQRRFYAFSDVAVSNCNAYWIGSAAALKAADAFRGGGQFVKKPVRIARAFGIINLLRFRFGLGPIHVVFDRLGRHMRLRLAPVLLSDGAAAIDVDHARSLGVTEAVMAERNCKGMAARAA